MYYFTSQEVPLLEEKIRQINTKYFDASRELVKLKEYKDSVSQDRKSLLSEKSKIQNELERMRRENKELRKSLENLSPRTSPYKVCVAIEDTVHKHTKPVQNRLISEQLNDNMCFSPSTQSPTPSIKWTPGTPLPVKMFMTSAVAINKAVYIGGGYNSSSSQPLTDIYRLDTETGAWVIIPRRDPEHTTSGFAIATYKERLLVIGGEYSTTKKGTNVSDKVLTLDVSSLSGKWNSKMVHSLNTPRYIPEATVYLDYLVVAGGRGVDDEPVPTMEIINLEHNKKPWTVTMPIRSDVRPQLLVFKDKFIIGSNTRESREYMSVKSVQCGELFDYLKLSDKQKKKRELTWESNPPQRRGAAIFTANEELMAVGGIRQQSYCYVYNETNMVWENKLPRPDTIRPRERAAAVPLGEDMVIVLGGREEHQSGQQEPVNIVDIATFIN